MPKKLLYIIHGFNPIYKDGMANRVKSFIDCFTQSDYKVTVVALPSVKDYANVLKNRYSLDKKVNWIIIPTFASPNHILIDRINTIYISIVLFVIGIFIKPKFTLADAAKTIAMCKLLKSTCAIIGNYRADSVDEMMQLLNCEYPDPRVQNELEYVKASAKISDYSICVSKRLKSTVEQQAQTPLVNNFIFPCCAKIDRFENVTFNHDAYIIIGYFGGLNKWQCIPQVIKFVIELRKLDNRYKLLIITQSKYDKFNNLLSELGENNYTIKSSDINGMPQLISQMDVSFAIRDNYTLNIVSSPTKLSESLAAGVPLIVSQYSGDYEEIVDDTTGCVIDDTNITPENISKIHQFCQKVKNNRALYYNNCRNKISDRTWEKYRDNFISFIEKR